MHLLAYPGVDSLPASYAELLECGARHDVRWSRSWLDAVMGHRASIDDAPLLFGVENSAGRPRAVAAALSSVRYSKDLYARALILAQGDDTPYRPLVADGVSPLEILRMVAHHARRCDPAYDVLRVSPLDTDTDAELFQRLPSALRGEGWIPQRFLMFANWYEHVSGLGSDEFLRGRPSRLRSTVERRARSLLRSGRSRIEVIRGGPALDTSISDYELVFTRSWKRGLGEVSVNHLHAIIRVAAQAGALRLALLYVDNVPAAAQLWLINAGVAHLYRLAYDGRFRELSPGTVLTWHVVKEMLDVEKVQELDLGIGDDAYKADWVSGRRERWGILGFNPRTWGGLKAAGRNIGGRAAKHVVQVLLHPLAARSSGG